MNYKDYDDYLADMEEKAKVPFEDYRELEEKLKKYEMFVEDIEGVFENPRNSKYDLQCIQALLEDLKGALKDV